jgi:hypothetical protein
MENFPTGPAPGQYPHRFTQDDRFQFRNSVQPVAGNLEFSIRAVDTRLPAMAAERAWMGYPLRTAPAADTDHEDNVRRAKWRAKKQIRLLALEMGVDRLFTFTVRLVGHPLPYNQFLRAWDFFRRMAEHADKNVRYLAVPELQVNGQYHMHAGVKGYQNVRNLTRMWQIALNKVLGRSRDLIHGADSPGTCNIANKKPMSRNPEKCAARIASYIAKYVGKSLENQFNRKRYFHSTGVVVQPAKAYWLAAQTRDGAVMEVLRRWNLLDQFGIPIVDIWRRDSCSAWFTLKADAIVPPF